MTYPYEKEPHSQYKKTLWHFWHFFVVVGKGYHEDEEKE